MSRDDSGKVVTTFNTFIVDRGTFIPSTLKPLGKRVRLIADIPDDFDNALQRYRYMF